MARTPRRWLARTLETPLRRAAREFPVVVLTGPRQSGKTTLLQKVLGARGQYVSLDQPDVRERARSDPRGFLAAAKRPLVLDEVQHAPEILSYIRGLVDEQRSKAGQFFLSGSQNLLLSQHVTETLAGRAAVLRLLPLSLEEVRGGRDEAPFWLRAQPREDRRGASASALWLRLLRGCFPELVSGPGRDAALWHAGYVQTYLERDVRTLRHIGDLGAFQSFVRALAARSANLVNFAELSRDLGVALNTVRAWVSVLEASYQIVVVRPYHANVQKRMVKTPKIYFTDTGTLCWLVGIRDAEHARQGPMAGAILETAVLGEILKASWHRGEEARVWFWRTSDGHEVDFVVEHGTELIPIEVRASSTPRIEMSRGIEVLHQQLPRKTVQGILIHTGSEALEWNASVRTLPASAV